MFFVQSVVMFTCCVYQLTAIFCFRSMFRYRMIVSRFNKLNLLLAVVLLAMAYYHRLGGAGKYCSGDHLTEAERNDPATARLYLLEEGAMLRGLITSSWVIVVSASIGAVVLGIAAYLAFK